MKNLLLLAAFSLLPLLGQSPCDGSLNRLPISITSATGNQQIIPAVAGRQIVICHISLAASASGAIKITEGTGTNCGSESADVTGAYQGALGFSRDPGDGALFLASGKAACLNFSATVTAGGVVLYAYR